MKTVNVASLNPSEFTIAQPCAAVDTFEMTNDDGSFVTTIDERFIDRLCANMNAREINTGDLCPIVIGHTPPAGTHIDDELNGNPLIGFARNWRKMSLGITGRPAAFFDPWIFTEDVPRAKKAPRRSCEVWVSRCEVDPISCLGSTTPARDLGLMKFNRNGSYTYESPGEMTMPEDKEKKPDAAPAASPTAKDGVKADKAPEGLKSNAPSNDQMPKPDPKETGAAVHDTGLLNQILATLTQLVQAQSGGTGIPDPGAAQDPNAEGDLSDEDLEAMLNEGGQEGEDQGEGNAPPAPGEPAPETPASDASQSRKGEVPEKESSCGGQSTMVPNLVKKLSNQEDDKIRLSRLEQENDTLRVQLSRRDVVDRLAKIRASGKEVDPQDEELVADLIAMEPSMRNRQLDRLEKLSGRRIASDGSFLLNTALADSTVGTPGGGPKRVRSKEEQNEIVRLAREQGKTYESVARAQGYTL